MAEVPAWLGDEEAATEGTTLGAVWAALRRAWEKKAEGGEAFASGDLDGAKEAYLEAEAELARAASLARLEGLADEDADADGRLRRALAALRGPVQANLSLACLRLGQPLAARRHAEASLEADPHSVKALYRRALAALELGEPEVAEQDLRAALEVEPQSRELRSALRRCRDAGRDSSSAGGQPPPQQPGPPPPPSSSSKPAPKPPQEQKPSAAEAAVLADVWRLASEGRLTADVRRAAEDWAEAHGASALLGCAGPAGEVGLLSVLCKTRGGEEETLVSATLPRLAPAAAAAAMARRDVGGRVPLHFAAAAGSERTTAALLDTGAETELLDDDEQTALHLAASAGHARVASLLLDAGCRADAQDRFGRTPLYYSGVSGHKAVAALLVDRGKADQSILFHALKEKFGTHNFMLQEWPEYNGRWMSTLEGRAPDLPLRPVLQRGEAPDAAEAQADAGREVPSAAES